jgi:hypothetical protein
MQLGETSDCEKEYKQIMKQNCVSYAMDFKIP